MKLLLTYLCLIAIVALPAEGQDRRRKESESNVVTGRAGARSLVPVNLSVRGLNSANANRVTTTLAEAQRDVYGCTRCSAHTYRPGRCSNCAGEADVSLLTSTKLFSRVGLSTDRGRLIVTVNPHHWASLEELITAVESSGAQVNRSSFRLPDNCRVKLKGVAPERGAQVRGALVDLEVLDRVIVTSDQEGLWIVPLGQSRVSLGQIQEVLTRLDPSYEVEDVEWASYCPHCGRVPTMRMGAPDCRER